MLKKGDLCKHFKGEDLIQKNIYEILATGVVYTGESKSVSDSLIVYRNIFQENKFFAREARELNAELSEEKQAKFHQKYRVQKLTDEEIAEISTEEFKKAKKKYIESKEQER